MRKAWMEWVAKTRKRGNRGKGNTMSHREALKAAAVTWPKEKAKIIRRQKRERKVSNQQSVPTPVAKKESEPAIENAQT